MKKTKGFERFLSRINYFSEDLELVSVIYNSREMLKGDDTIFANVTDKTPTLQKRLNSVGSRQLVTEHLQHTVYTSYIKDLYEEVDEYFLYLVTAGIQSLSNKEQIISYVDKDFSPAEILKLNDYKSIMSFVAYRIVKSLDAERSTIAKINKINKMLNLNVSKDVIQGALPYLEVRHIFVHSDGKPDKGFKYLDVFHLDRKRRIKLTDTDIANAREKITNLVKAFDEAMTRRKLFPKTEYNIVHYNKPINK